jgi:hypothetical protein
MPNEPSQSGSEAKRPNSIASIYCRSDFKLKTIVIRKRPPAATVNEIGTPRFEGEKRAWGYDSVSAPICPLGKPQTTLIERSSVERWR